MVNSLRLHQYEHLLLAINLLLISIVMLLTALLLGIIVVILVSPWVVFLHVSHSHKVCFIVRK